MKVASLFSGCGGLDWGLRKAGHQIVAQCENDEACRLVLKKQFSGVLSYEDVVSIPELPRDIELLAVGFPCTDLSLAGSNAGIHGAESGQWVHITRLLRQAKERGSPVPWVLLENVPASLDTSNREPTGMEEVTSELEALEYNCAYRTIDAASFGIPASRPRVVLVASQQG